MARPAFAARGMEITPGWENVEITMDPSGLVEARIGVVAARAGACARRWPRSSPTRSASSRTQIRVMHGDTDRTPYGWGTFASRSLVIAGGASLIAARKLRTKLLKIASHMLEASAADIVLEGGAAKVSGTDRSVPIATMARAGLLSDAIGSTARSSPA